MSNTICRICGNKNNNQTYQVKEMMFGFGDKFTYFECSMCGCLQISEIPANILMYYPSNYYSFSEISSTFSVGSIKSHITQLLKQKRTNYAIMKRGIIGKLVYNLFPDEIAKSLSKVNLTEDSRILDVGCGSGSLLYHLKEIGFKNLLGLDKFIKKDILYANGLRIQKGSLQDINGQWNLIMFNHSLEHMQDQQGIMQAVSRLLNRDGVCIINTPTVSSYAWKNYKIHWVQLDAPRHYFLHSVRSLRLLAEKASLELIGISYNSTAFQFWGSEQYIRNIPLRSAKSYSEKPLASVFSMFQLKRFKQRSKELNSINQGDQAAFYIMKKK
ncbi:MAG: class I SAM-dependent methyltransferase [Promethearchaeota archaeon]